jgi:hypothetical protein
MSPGCNVLKYVEKPAVFGTVSSPENSGITATKQQIIRAQS